MEKKEKSISLRTKFKFASINKSYRMIYGHQAAALLEAVLSQMEYWESKGKLKTKGKLPNYTTTYADLSYHSGIPMNTLQKFSKHGTPINTLVSQKLIMWISTGPGTPHVLKISLKNIDKILTAVEKIDEKIKEIMTFLTDYRKKKEKFMQELSKVNGNTVIKFLKRWVSIVKNELFEDISESTCHLAIDADDLAIGADDLAIPTSHRQATKNSKTKNSNSKNTVCKKGSPSARNTPKKLSSEAKAVLALERKAPTMKGATGISRPTGATELERSVNAFYTNVKGLNGYTSNIDKDLERFVTYPKKIREFLINDVLVKNTFPSVLFRKADAVLAEYGNIMEAYNNTPKPMLLMHTDQDEGYMLDNYENKLKGFSKKLKRMAKKTSDNDVISTDDLDDLIN